MLHKKDIITIPEAHPRASGLYKSKMNDIEIENSAVGCFCTLLEDWRGYSDGEIVADYGMEYMVKLPSGQVLTVNRDDVIVFD